MMLQQLANFAVGGFGASFGRDLYRGAKKNPILFAIIGGLLLAFGWRNLFLGRGRGFAYNLFVTGIGSVLMITIGGLMIGVVGFYIATIVNSSGGQPNLLIPVALVALVSLIGILWGRRDAQARVRMAEIQAKNVAFLESIGLMDSGFESDTLQDTEGNFLKIRESGDDRIVFSVANRRGLRAAIGLKNGEMVSYTGIVKV